MSIQAGWNYAISSLAAFKKLGSMSKSLDQLSGAERAKQRMARESMIAKRYSNRQEQAQASLKNGNGPSWQGPLDPYTAKAFNTQIANSDNYNEIQSENGWGDPQMIGTPAGQAMMEQQIAMQQAQEAAAIADMAPQNHGYMASLEQQVESAAAADTDPMAELNRMTNSAMDEMDRRANIGGNN